MITTETMRGMIMMMSRVIGDNRAQLNALDAELGDGDHGTTIANGFEMAARDIQEASTPAEVLSMTAKILMNRMGGSSGALFGTLFLRAGMTVKDQDTLSAEQFAQMWQAGADAVMQRGKAQVGDKTMVDALVPATSTLRQAIDNGELLLSALEKSSDAGAQGAKSTTPLEAKYGRARYLGERAIGHVDAGAQSVALLFEAMHIYWKEYEHGKA